uniref:Uncharacterized protein n=1 Tax=Magallana gigas TaxID=29159 RepID=K1QP81_MAGGI
MPKNFPCPLMLDGRPEVAVETMQVCQIIPPDLWRKLKKEETKHTPVTVSYTTAVKSWPCDHRDDNTATVYRGMNLNTITVSREIRDPCWL